MISISMTALGGVISGFYFYLSSNPVLESNLQANNHANYSYHNGRDTNANQGLHIIYPEDANILQHQQAINQLVTQLEHIHQQIDNDKQRWFKQTLSDNPSSLSTKPDLFSMGEIEPTELANYGRQYAEWLAPKALVSLGKDWLDNVHIGGEFALPSLPNTSPNTPNTSEMSAEIDYVAQVTHKTELWNGDYLIKARVHKATLNDQAKTDKNALPLLIAMNTETGTAYMSYATHEGSYEAELQDGLGELYAVNDIDRATEQGKYDDVIHDIRDIRQIHANR